MFIFIDKKQPNILHIRIFSISAFNTIIIFIYFGFGIGFDLSISGLDRVRLKVYRLRVIENNFVLVQKNYFIRFLTLSWFILYINRLGWNLLHPGISSLFDWFMNMNTLQININRCKKLAQLFLVEKCNTNFRQMKIGKHDCPK